MSCKACFTDVIVSHFNHITVVTVEDGAGDSIPALFILFTYKQEDTVTS